MIKIKLILGGEDGKFFGELLFFGFSVEHALLSPSCTHVSPSQCRGKFPAHHLRLCAGAELSPCLPQNHCMVMSFPFNNLPFSPLHIPKWKSRGGKKSLNPLHRIWVPVLVLGHFLSLSLFSAWRIMGRGAGCCWPRENFFLLPCPVFVGRARSVMELMWGERPGHTWNLECEPRNSGCSHLSVLIYSFNGSWKRFLLCEWVLSG